MSAPKKEYTHVDDFVEDYTKSNYARWFLFLKRLPANLQADFAEFIEPFTLYATWKGKRYRVTGASRLGDVWLTSDFKRDTGYEHRVDVDDLTEFGKVPE